MPVTIVGNNTPTAGGVVYGDGTNYASTAAGTSGQPLVSGGSGAPAFRPYTLPAADGAANQVLQTNGSGALSFASPAAGLGGISVFTSSGTFTVPSGITKVKVTITGGGGGGTSGSGYGGAGATAIKYWTVSPGNTISITIGAGGTTGNNGGASTAVFSATTVTANGGIVATVSNGTSPTATNGDLNIKGGTGGSGVNAASTGMAVSFWGPPAFNVDDAGAYGSGGSATNSRTGTSGICIVEY